MKRFAVLAMVGGVVVGAGRAHADVDELKEYLKHPAPAPGIEKAPLTAPTWCAGHEHHTFEPGAVGRSIDSYRSQQYWDTLLKAGEYLCDGDPKNPIVQAAAQEILQYWMNAFGLTAKDAIETFNAHMQKDKLEAAHQQLCDALAISDEVEGEERAHMLARRNVFGCNGTNNSVLWDVLPYFDASETPPDPLAQLGYLVSSTSYIQNLNKDYLQKALVGTVVDQYDYATFDPNAVLKEAEQPPYKGNLDARVSILEALATYRRGKAIVDSEIAKLAKDPDWKALLVAAPQAGIAAWNTAAAKYKDALARSNALEHAAMGPSKKAMAGCEPALRKDVAGLLKTLKHDTEAQLQKELSDSLVGGLLLKRLILCMAGDGDAMMASVIDNHIDHVRITRGPRHAAYFAAIDAYNKIKEDREKFPVDAKYDFNQYYSIGEINKRIGELINKREEDSFGYRLGDEKGVIATVTKAGDYMKVTFAPDKHKMPAGECHATNHILQFDGNGNPIYDQVCNFHGTVMVDFKPDPIQVPLAQAAGLKPGRFVEFATARGSSKAPRPAVPLRVYSDKTGSKLAAWLGFEL
jgi:hypothetical protein